MRTVLAFQSCETEQICSHLILFLKQTCLLYLFIYETQICHWNGTSLLYSYFQCTIRVNAVFLSSNLDHNYSVHKTVYIVIKAAIGLSRIIKYANKITRGFLANYMYVSTQTDYCIITSEL